MCPCHDLLPLQIQLMVVGCWCRLPSDEGGATHDFGFEYVTMVLQGLRVVAIPSIMFLSVDRVCEFREW